METIQGRKLYGEIRYIKSIQLSSAPQLRSHYLKGRQLQTIELQGNEKLRVSFIKFSLKNNYDHKGNQFNQVGLMGVSVWGKVKPEPNKAGGLKQRKTEAEMDRVPRRQDLAFLMYTDKDVAEVIFLNDFYFILILNYGGLSMFY